MRPSKRPTHARPRPGDPREAERASILRDLEQRANLAHWEERDTRPFLADVGGWLTDDAPHLARSVRTDTAERAFGEALDVLFDRYHPEQRPKNLGELATALLHNAHGLDAEVEKESARGATYDGVNLRHRYLLRFLFWRVLAEQGTPPAERAAALHRLDPDALDATDVDRLLKEIAVDRNPIFAQVIAVGVQTDVNALEVARREGVVVSLPARTLGRATRVGPVLYGALFVVENPNVLAALVERLEAADLAPARWPTIVCTSGQGSATALELIERLIYAGDVSLVYVSTDRDDAGGRIRARVQRRVELAVAARAHAGHALLTSPRVNEDWGRPTVSLPASLAPIEEARIPWLWEELAAYVSTRLGDDDAARRGLIDASLGYDDGPTPDRR